MTVVIGIDPHKASHTATAIGPGSVEAATIRLRAARSTPEELLSWAAQWPERRWGVEGARGLGQLLAQQLVAAGEHVVDVPATLSARVRTLDTGHGRKTDRIDARAVALVAAQRPDLPRVTADDHCRVLRLLADRSRRADQRTAPHDQPAAPTSARPDRRRSAHPAQRQGSRQPARAKVRPRDGVEAERKQMARDLLVDVRRLDRALAQNRRRCAAARVAASGTNLCDLAGISDVLAAKILGHIGDIGRLPQRRPPRQLRRHRADRSQQRRRRAPPTVTPRQPPTQPRHPPRRPHPDHPPRPRPRLLPAPTRHRQQPQRSPPTPQTTTHQNHLPHPPRRRTACPTPAHVR